MNYRDELVEEQDRHLDEIIGVAGRLKGHTQGISRELDKQADKINQLDGEVERTTKKLGFVQQKLSDLLKTNDPSQICTILLLFAILLVLIFLVIYT